MIDAKVAKNYIKDHKLVKVTKPFDIQMREGLRYAMTEYLIDNRREILSDLDNYLDDCVKLASMEGKTYFDLDEKALREVPGRIRENIASKFFINVTDPYSVTGMQFYKVNASAVLRFLKQYHVRCDYRLREVLEDESVSSEIVLGIIDGEIGKYCLRLSLKILKAHNYVLDRVASGFNKYEVSWEF